MMPRPEAGRARPTHAPRPVAGRRLTVRHAPDASGQLQPLVRQHLPGIARHHSADASTRLVPQKRPDELRRSARAPGDLADAEPQGLVGRGTATPAHDPGRRGEPRAAARAEARRACWKRARGGQRTPPTARSRPRTATTRARHGRAQRQTAPRYPSSAEPTDEARRGKWRSLPLKSGTSSHFVLPNGSRLSCDRARTTLAPTGRRWRVPPRAQRRPARAAARPGPRPSAAAAC